MEKLRGGWMGPAFHSRARAGIDDSGSPEPLTSPGMRLYGGGTLKPDRFGRVCEPTFLADKISTRDKFTKGRLSMDTSDALQVGDRLQISQIILWKKLLRNASG